MNPISRIVAMAALACAGLSAQPVAAQDMAPLSAFGDLPSVERVALSPSGKRTAIVYTLNGERSILVLDENNKPVGQYPLGDLKIRSMELASDGILLLTRSATSDLNSQFLYEKSEFYQGLIVYIDERRMESIFSDRREVMEAIYGYDGMRMVDGRPKAYFSGLDAGRGGRRPTQDFFRDGKMSLFEVDLMTNKSTRILDRSRWPERRTVLIDDDGSVFVKMLVNANSGSWELVNTSGDRLASGQSKTGEVGLVAIGQNGDTVIYTAEDATGDTPWYEVPIDGSSGPQEILADVNLQRIYTAPFTRRLIGYLPDGDDAAPVFFDQALNARATAVRGAFPGLNPRMSDWAGALDQVLVYTSGNQDSGTYYAVDLGARRADAIAYARQAIKPDMVGPVSRVNYSARDGLDLDGILTLPPGRAAKNLPLVMLPHGGPNASDGPGFDWWAQAFASRGYAVFQPNFRGSTHRDRDFVSAGDGEWGGKMLTDMADGMAALAQQGVVDPERACIVGASYGGYAALAGVTILNDLYRCAVSVNGVADVQSLSRLENRGSSKVFRRSLAELMGPTSTYRVISPRYNAGKADAPILLIHGKEDTVVEFAQSRNMADALKDAGKPYEFVELDGEDHWLSLGETRRAMLDATIAFVEKHNPPN